MVMEEAPKIGEIRRAREIGRKGYDIMDLKISHLIEQNRQLRTEIRLLRLELREIKSKNLI